MNFNLLMAFTVIYLTFNKVIYKTYLPNIFELSRIEGFATLSSSIMDLLRLSPPNIEKYMYPPSPIIFFSTEYFEISILKYGIILFPIIVFIGSIIFKVVRDRELLIDNHDPRFLLFYSLLFTFCLEGIAYFIVGRVSFVYLSTILPILAVFSIKNLYISHNARRKILIVFLIVLIIASLGKFTLAKNTNFNALHLSYTDIKDSSNWLENTSDAPTYTMISDFRVWGMYIVEGSNSGVYPRYHYISLDDYVHLVEGKSLSQGIYFICDKKDINRPVISMFWWYFEPFSLHYQEINCNSHLNKIYVTENVEIYKTLRKTA